MFARITLSGLQTSACLILAAVALSVPATMADEPAASPSDQTEEQESLDVRYARAHLRLANLDLLRFLEVQKEHPGALPIEASADLKRHVAIDEEQLKQALKGPDADLHEIYMRSAKLAVELAKRDLQRKREAFEEFPNDEQAFAVKRAETVVELAQLQLQITLSKRSAMSSMMYLQWQIELLRNQVLELQIQLKSQSRRQ